MIGITAPSGPLLVPTAPEFDETLDDEVSFLVVMLYLVILVIYWFRSYVLIPCRLIKDFIYYFFA